MLADNVLKVRISLGLSQVKFAEKCEMPRTTLRDIEKGKVQNPTLFQICRICIAGNITPNDLIPKEYYT